MLKSTKFYSSLAASLLLSGSLLVPATHAQTLNQKETQLTREFQQFQQSQHQLPHYLKAQTASAAAISTQIEYKQPIQSYQIHGYLFKTDGGTFTVKTLHTPTDALDYRIYSVDNDTIMTTSSTGDISLPAGTYEFLVAAVSDQPITYDYELDGAFSVEPDATLPTVNVTAPTTNEFRIQKGASDAVSFTGSSTNADQLSLSVDGVDTTLPTTGEFTHIATMKSGVNMAELDATGATGNIISNFYYITFPGISRLQGKDRYEVSSNISQELVSAGANTSGTIIIARGDVFSDALSAGPLATEEDAPILLTATNSLPDSVIAQIQSLLPTKAIILGGTGSVSTNVESQLKALGVTTIDRISGKDRYAVDASVGERISASNHTDTAIIASGEVFPDALSANTLAGALGMPVLLVQSGTVPDSIQTYITNHPEVTNFIVVGGTGTVNDSVVSKVQALRSGAVVDRIDGKDRYEVSLKVAEYAIEHYKMNMSNVTIARGDLFPDALSGAAFANYIGAPILLTPTNQLDPQISSFLSAHSSEIDDMYIFGGTGSVSQNVENQLNQYIK